MSTFTFDWRRWLLRVTTGWLLLASIPSVAATMTEQANYCAAELGFTALPPGSCMGPNTIKTAGDSSGLDSQFIGYFRLSDTVDAVYHCDEVNEIKKTFTGNIELNIHNRVTGKTCYFQANKTTRPILDPDEWSVEFPTLTAQHTNADNSKQDAWRRPSILGHIVNNESPRPCLDCHTTGGPYLIGERNLYAMGIFGLLNNGHDTQFTKLRPVNVDKQKELDEAFYLATLGLQPMAACASACHLLQDNTKPQQSNGSLFGVAKALVNDGYMPPDTDSYNDYRWLNMDNPSVQNSNGEGDYETLAWLQNNYPQFYCSNPSNVEAHAVNDEFIFYANNLKSIPDKLRTFNLRDGLVCLNADQGAGKQCHNYDVRYQCSDGSLTNWYMMDSPSYDGDHEERFNDANVCTPTQQKPTLKAVGIQARYYVNGVATPEINGPNEQLYQFDTKNGLACRNQDQPNGQCLNYVVRFICDASTPATLTFKNVWTGRMVTSTGVTADTKAQPLTASWNTQGWILEPVDNTSYFRLKNTGSGSTYPVSTYLYAQSSAEGAKVVTSGANSSLLEQWAIEPIANSSEVRIKNVGANRYLTVADAALINASPDYAPIYSQALSPNNWTSQRWIIQ